MTDGQMSAFVLMVFFFGGGIGMAAGFFLGLVARVTDELQREALAAKKAKRRIDAAFHSAVDRLS